MPFPVPNLDNRTFQGIVDELKQRIPLYCPEWTDHNVSDPGVTLIELFAYVVEQMLYRMNQIPEQHYLQFAKWLGVQRRQPKAARANVGFWLSSPPKSPLLIPRETRVATTQTETQPSQEYVLEKDFIVYAPKLKKIIPAHGNQQPIIDVKEDGYFVDRPSISVFSPKRPVKDDCLYLGFDTGEVISKGNTKQAIDLSHHMLEIAVSVEFNAAGGGRREAPYSIAAFSNQKGDGDHNNEGNWIVCDFVDFTENMNKDGAISFILPGMPPAELFRQRPHQWLRIKLISDDVYSDESPLLRRVVVSSVGFTTSVVHAHEEAIDEFFRMPAMRGANMSARAVQNKVTYPLKYCVLLVKALLKLGLKLRTLLTQVLKVKSIHWIAIVVRSVLDQQFGRLMVRFGNMVLFHLRALSCDLQNIAMVVLGLKAMLAKG